MNCPKCLGKLSPVIMGNVELDRCFICEGIRFDPGELGRVLDNYMKDLENITLDSDVFDAKEASEYSAHFSEKEGTCPHCNAKTLTSKENHSGIVIDYCPEGHGIWLDGGEIASLKKNKKRNVINYYSLFKYMFSIEGFKDFFKSMGRKSYKNIK